MTLRAMHVLDTEPESRFDRLTRMARRMFRVPIALVSLIDENRQWFKSCMGLDAHETPRDISFCGHAILGDCIFIIPDALLDDRFADNPLVIGPPHIRFYAGCPLKAPNGQKLGTLCIIDTQPRTLDDDDLQALNDLAAMVEQELATLQLATQDELTEIPNRRGFLLLAQHTLNLCARQHLPASLVFIDLNGFKSINDRFGHAEGDRALVTFAQQLKLSCRDSDVLGRLGGDEFVLLLSDTSPADALKTIGRLSDTLQDPNHLKDRGYSLTFTHGIVAFDAAAHPSIESLLAHGDRVMYQSKHSPR